VKAASGRTPLFGTHLAERAHNLSGAIRFQVRSVSY
jgi:hypothetical protein